MSLVKRALRASPDQQKIMVEFLEKHRNFKEATNDFTKAQYDAYWDELSLKLNSCGGGAQKDVDKWKSTLSDWKTAVKKKAANLKKAKTGGGPPPKPLTILENKLLEVIGKIVVAGDHLVEEAGFESQTQIDSSSTKPQIPHQNDKSLQFLDNFGKSYDIFPSSSPTPCTSKTNDVNKSSSTIVADENIEIIEQTQDVNILEETKKQNERRHKKRSAARLAPYDAAAKELREIQFSTDEVLRGIQSALELNAKALENISEAEHRKAQAEEIKAQAAKKMVDYKIQKLEIAKEAVKAQLQFSSAIGSMVQALNDRRES